MTNETIIDILATLWCYEHTDKYTETEIREALATAIVSVKKQTAEKPIPLDKFGTENICPRCKKKLKPCFLVCGVKTGTEHHCECGQALDWS